MVFTGYKLIWLYSNNLSIDTMKKKVVFGPFVMSHSKIWAWVRVPEVCRVMNSSLLLQVTSLRHILPQFIHLIFSYNFSIQSKGQRGIDLHTQRQRWNAFSGWWGKVLPWW